MATFLSKLFKPKWQSASIETRKQALADLDTHKPEEHSILLKLAETDASFEVQQAAIQRIRDTESLIQLHKKVRDPLRSILENRLYELATEQSLSIFDLIIDMDILSEMIIKAVQADSFMHGLARIEDGTALLKIAMQARNAQIRQAAAELLESENELNLLFAHAKNKDKAVFQIAKTKLAKLKSLAQEQADIRRKLEKLLADLQNLSQTEALQHFDARLNHVLKQWPALKDAAEPAELEQFEALSAECESKRQAMIELASSAQSEAAENASQASSDNAAQTAAENQQETASESQQEPPTEIYSELQSTLATLHETLNRFRSQAATVQEISALDALVKTQENRWIEASETEEATKAIGKSYQDAMSELRNYLQALRVFKEQADKLSSLTEQLNAGLHTEQSAPNGSQISTLLTARKQLAQLIGKIDWPAQCSKPESLVAAENALAASSTLKQQQAEQLKQVDRKFEQLLQELDNFLEEKQIKEANKILKKLQTLLNPLPAHQSQKYQPALSLRSNQLHDLRDWQGFASEPKQLELCEAMERLSEMHIDPNDKAEKIKAMQHEWKALGGSSDKALWERFKTAADKAFEPCALFFAEQQQLKANNLKKRETLVEQLETYLSSIDWQAVSSRASQPTWTTSDWKTADKINRQARQEWKDAFPIDFKAGKPIQHRFNQLIEQFDQHLSDERTFNLGRKQAIVDQARALLAESDATMASETAPPDESAQQKHEQALQQHIKTIKSLQENWQQVGITPHKEDRQLWTEFRKACDAIFAKRNQLRDAQRSEINQAVNDAERRCQEAEASISNAAAQTEEQLRSLIAEHRKSMQALPKLPAGVHEKISQRFDQVISQIQQELSRRQQQTRILVWQEVARKATILRGVYAEVSARQQALDSEKQAALEGQFKSSLALPESLETTLEKLWQCVVQNQLAELNPIQEEQARALCIACEIAAGIDSPEADKALRMQVQVNRLSEGLSGAENLSNLEQLENALASWYGSVGLDQASLAKFEARIQAATEALLKF